MKKIIFFLTLIFLATSTSVMAQQEQDDKKAEKEAKKAKKEAKKAAQKAEKLLLFDQASKALEEHKFIYKIDRVQVDNGRFTPTDNRGSFFELNDTITTSQIDRGSTVSTPKVVYGKASNFKLTTDKKGNVTFEFTLREKTNIYPKDIKIRLEKESNEASMVIAEKRGTRVYLRGTIIPLGSETMFRGTPIIF